MYRILISGYYGFNNIGDESILKAVVESLRMDIDDVEITVLSQNPTDTAERFSVTAVDRRSFKAIIPAIHNCDLLISGGGSLLQDVTSRKSILYYLLIMQFARIMRKPFFIYSQGIGPIKSDFNKKLTARVLRKAGGIVVRDEFSKEFLSEIGIPLERIVITADPVLAIPKVELDSGYEILRSSTANSKTADTSTDYDIFESEETVSKNISYVGFAIKDSDPSSEFIAEICDSIEWMIRERGYKAVLIPFHFSQDVAVVEHMEKVLTARGFDEDIICLKQKYLTDEMLSIIGNMDLLVGVRLHALIHAAIMEVPMMAISYDPKVNSFMHSIGMKAMCSIYDFKSDFFKEEFDRTVERKEQIKARISDNLLRLKSSLKQNQIMITELLGRR